MKTIYKRRLSQSYLIIDQNYEDEHSCELEIFSYNKVPGLLSIETETVDGVFRFWYEITGRQSLADYLGRRQADMKLICVLFLALEKICSILQDYLLTESGILLQAEYIYLDFEQKHAEFVYLPGWGEDIRGCFRNLMEQILQNLNHDDRQAVAAAYEVYQRTLQDEYSLKEMLAEVVKPFGEECLEEGLKQQAKADVREEMRGENGNVKAFDTETVHSAQPAEMSRKVNADAIRNIFLNVRAAAFHFLKSKIRHKRKPVMSYAVCPEDVVSVPQEIMHPTELLYSNNEVRGILMYRGADGLSDINIQKQSFLIGKKESEVDGFIDRGCISRVHAKIESDGDEYYIEDMNSTNGTYLNGQPLEYHQRVRLKEGDNITFGTVEYRFL